MIKRDCGFKMRQSSKGTQCIKNQQISFLMLSLDIVALICSSSESAHFCVEDSDSDLLHFGSSRQTKLDCGLGMQLVRISTLLFTEITGFDFMRDKINKPLFR